MHHARRRRQVERQGVEKPRFRRDPANLGPPAGDSLQHSRAFLWQPGRRCPCHRPVRRHRRHGDRGLVARRAFCPVRGSKRERLRDHPRQLRGARSRRRGPHPPARCAEAQPAPRAGVSVLPFSIRPMARVLSRQPSKPCATEAGSARARWRSSRNARGRRSRCPMVFASSETRRFGVTQVVFACFN